MLPGLSVRAAHTLMNDAPGGRVGEVSEPSKATSPSALPWEPEPSLAVQGSTGARQEVSMGTFGNTRLGFLSACAWRWGRPWGFWVILCALFQTSKPFSFTTDGFYNGFLQNVPSLLFLVTKLYLLARSVIC